MSGVTREEIRHIYSSSALNYQMLLKVYRGLGVNLAKWREDAIRRLPDLKQPRILDVSTGTGANLPLLVEKYPDYKEVVGIDYTPAMLHQAKRRVRNNNWKNIQLTLGDAREMSKVVDGKFDLIMSTYSLSIIPDSTCVLDEMNKLVSKDGIYNPIAIFLSTRLGGNFETYSVPVSDLASKMFTPVYRRLMYSGMFYEDLYRSKKS
ncbi:MAG: class I SAM-dependent methyltransferase [Candidatus Thorarchaeota archaeon]|jgi:ubiquinone/menaquinone biosynthesis C-methylase UbiE